MKSIILIITSFLYFTNSYAQNINTDSLENILSSQRGKEKFKTLSDLCYYLSFSNVEKSEKYGNSALQMAKEMGDSTLIANAYNDLSILFTIKSNYKKGLEYNLKAYQIRKRQKNPEKLISSLSKIGVCYSELGEFKKAARYIIEALTIVENNNLVDKYYLVYDNLGGIYKEMHNFKKALVYHSKAYELAIENNNIRAEYTCLVNVAGAHRSLGDTEKSIELHLEAEKIITNGNDLRTKALVYSNLASLYSSINNFEKAISYSKISIPIYEEIQNYDGLSLVHNNIALFHIDNNKLTKTNQLQLLSHLNKAKKYALKCNSLVRKNQNYIAYSQYFSATNSFKNAMLYRRKSDTIRDSIFTLENNKIVEEINTKYETEKKEKQLAIQKIEIAQQEVKVQNRNVQLVGMAGGIIILLMIGGFIYKNQKDKQHKLQQQVALEQAEVINKVQDEKLRISRDLHDNIGSQLTFVISSLDNMNYIKDENVRKNRLEELGDFTKDTMNQLRETIWAIKSESISLEQLVSKVAEFMDKAKVACPTINFSISTVKSDKNLNSNQAINVYRTLQEAINNAIKYAEAKTIKLVVNENSISITDDGIGFDRKTITEGNGLINMIARMKEVGFKTKIRSQKGEGTTISIQLS